MTKTEEIMEMVSDFVWEDNADDARGCFDKLKAAIEELVADAARYQAIRRGQKWSVIDGGGDTLRADELDAAIDKAMSEPKTRAAAYTQCKGTNCTATVANQKHSSECIKEHEAACSGMPLFTKEQP